MIVRLLGSVALWSAITSAGGMAQSVPLTFDVEQGQEVVRLVQVHTLVVETAADGIQRRREAARLGRVREQVLAQADGRDVVHMTVDSLVLRTRAEGEPWRESPPSEVLGWMQFGVDDRLNVRQLGGVREEAPLLQHLLAGFPGLLLPEKPTWPGRTWRQEFDVSPTDVTMGATPAAADGRLPIVMTVVVDSIVPRAEDTLVYLRLDGQLVPSRVRAADGSGVEYRGAVVGSLVWSSGWSRFVSAATRTTLTIGVASSTESSEVTVQTTVRQAVQEAP